MKYRLSLQRSFFALLTLLSSCALFGANTTKTNVPDVTVVGIVNTHDGLGSHATNFIESISNSQLDYRLYPISDGQEQYFEGLSKEVAACMQKSPTPLGKVIIYSDWLASLTYYNYADNFLKDLNNLQSNPASKEQVRVAFSVYESTQIPKEWVDCINQTFDCVVVPDPYYISVYIDSGVTKPVFYIPLPIKIEKFLNSPLKKGQSENVFSFACLGSYLERKNQITLIRAFAKKFKNNPHVQLYLNGRASLPQCYYDVISEINHLGLTNVMVNHYNLSLEDYLATYKKIDCLVNISRGEGFSIQPREAMALGVPTILSDNTAQSTMCKLDHVLAVPSNIPMPFFRTWDNSWEADGVNFDCSVDDVAEALESMYNNYSWYMSKSKEAREWTKQYLPENLKDFYLQVIAPSKIELSNTNEVTKEGIKTSSKELYDKYVRLFPQLGTNYKASNQQSRIKREDVFNVFDNIYEHSVWVGSAGDPSSGYGSRPEFCKEYISFLSNFIKENKIKKVLDLGCGDWTFSQLVDWGDAQYIGIDAVQSQIEHHNKVYASSTKKFHHMELSDALDKFGDDVDLIICKDVLQHLPYDYVFSITPKLSKAKHLLITNDLAIEEQSFTHDMTAPFSVGHWHYLDLSKAPFNLSVAKNMLLFPEEPGTKHVKTTQYIRNF